MDAQSAAPVGGTTGHGYIDESATTLPRLTGSRCRCAACLQFFNSTSAFDLHRTGTHGVDRHCREPSEMLALGMSVNDLGFWIERRRGEARQKRGSHAQETRSAPTLALERCAQPHSRDAPNDGA